MVEIKILSGSLKKRLQGLKAFKIKPGMNWICGRGESGKSTCIDILKNHKHYIFKKEIKTVLNIPPSKILTVDFGYCTCSDLKLDELFSLLRSGGSGECSRLRFLEELNFEASKSDCYEMILIDSPFYFVGDEHHDYVYEILESLSKDKFVIATVNDSKLIGSGNRLMLAPSNKNTI